MTKQFKWLRTRLLIIDGVHLITWCVRRHLTTPENNITLRFQSPSSHIVRYLIAFSAHMSIGRSIQLLLSSTDLLKRPIDGLTARTLVDPGNEADHQLAVSEDPGRMPELRSRFH